MKIAAYLRLSMADGDICDKKESNSIANQRILIHDFIESRDDLVGEIMEYVDDGYTGTNFDRPGFTKMIADAKKGKIEVIIAKDLSRLGRNYIDLGDYLEQIFPRIGVRVIAINSNYDSNEHIGDVAGLDAAITNFINAMYSKDLSVKQKSSYKTSWSQGHCPNARLPYGYVLDKENKGKWLIDGDAAKVIQYVFGLAAEGWRARKIADRLNELQFETPGAYLARVYNEPIRFKVTEHEKLWDYQKVRNLLRSDTYVGDFYVHKTESTLFGTTKGKQQRVPRDNWILLKDHHPEIVSRDLFMRAQNAITKKGWVDKHEPAEFSLRSKCRCGNCHLILDYIEHEKKMVCSHKWRAGKYSKCPKHKFSYETIERTVFAELQKYLRDMKALEYIVESTVGTHKTETEKSIKYHETQIDILKTERVRQYEGYAQGLITPEAYIKKKAELTAEIEEHQKIVESTKTELDEDYDVLTLVHDSCEAAEVIKDEIVLTKQMVDSFIDRVYVHADNRIEVTYKTEDIITKAIRRNNDLVEAEEVEPVRVTVEKTNN